MRLLTAGPIKVYNEDRLVHRSAAELLGEAEVRGDHMSISDITGVRSRSAMSSPGTRESTPVSSTASRHPSS